MSERVTTSVSDDVGSVTIDRPDQLNALNSDVHDALYDALERFEQEELSTVIIRSAGDRAFIAGADLKEIDGMDLRSFIEYQKNGRKLNDYIASHPAIVIAAVDGLAYGGGMEVALAADVVVASENATFALPEVTLGLVPGGGATQRLPRIAGKNLAIEMLTTGEPIDAERAAAAGIVNHVVETDAVRETAAELAETISANAPLAVREAKRLVNEGLEASLETGLSFEQEVTFQLYETDDVTEGIRAFKEDRDPEFTGE